MKDWRDFGIDISQTRGAGSEVKTICPQCSHTRKKSKYPCLNVSLDKGVWHCWHCDWSGSLGKGEERRSNPSASPVVFRKPVYRQTPLPQRVVDWFASRGIPEKVLARRRISYGPVYMPQVEQEVPAIQFPYFRQGETVNVKYRDGHKYFRMAGGAERILYGLDDIQGDTLLVCEGELDAMALEVAGFASVVSVPDGAPAVTAKNYESKFDFLLSAEPLLAPLRQIIIAVDNDAPGQKLADELARRLGPERCYRVTWASECKDANDVLMSHGPEVLRECIDNAKPWPVSGIVTVDMLAGSLAHMYAYGVERGAAPGWASLQQHYTVRPGELTVVTGIASHGKSAWVSALLVNLAHEHHWQFALFSPENHPLERFAATLAEQVIGKPFDGDYNRMSLAEMQRALAWLGEHFSFLMPDDDAPTVERLLALAKVQVYRQGIKGLVLDPWNEIEHSRPTGLSETEYISQVLTQIRRFARLHGVHVWIVAHPTKLQKAVKGEYEGKYPPPTPYDIAGSAHWRNKADNCITIWRDVESNSTHVEVHIQKVRFREIGRPGAIALLYDRTTGRFHEPRLEDQLYA